MARHESKKTRVRISKKTMGRTKKINTISVPRGGRVL